VEKPQKTSERRRQHMQRAALEMTSPMANETTDIIHLKRPEAQGPLTKVPLQKLPDEKPINAASGLSQPGDLVKVPIILAAQPLSPR
jgi:hypothetical protein